MVFKKFKDLFKAEDLLDSALSTTIKMLEFDQQMFEASRKTLRESDTAELPFDIKKTDRKINKYEREVRRLVLAHLSVSGVADLVPGLVLVSIVIDVERIGDYTKNMYDLAREHEKRLPGGSFEADIARMERHVIEVFPKTIDVLRNQDQDLGREIMRYEDDIGKRSEQIVADLIAEKDSTITGGSAIALALYARFLKRINAHLTNIASAIVNPFPRIGFREKNNSA
jgi:phosphate uptake regulator